MADQVMRNLDTISKEFERTSAPGLKSDLMPFDKKGIERSISDRFEKIARAYPDRLAIKSGSSSLTYEALNRAANRIARAIHGRQGQGSEPIALLFQHGIDVIAAILGVLKAGKFFVALDPSFPLKRISFMLEDSGAALIVTNDRNVNLVSQVTNDARGLLNIDVIDDSACSDNLGQSISIDDLVSIRYTSGSTGEPKGVIETHGNVLHSVNLLAERIHTSIDDRFSLLHATTFGSSQVNLFQSLLNGASLFPFDIKCEGILRLQRWLKEEQITVYHSPPAVFRQLADSLSKDDKFSSVRLIHLSGAPITQLDFELYKKSFSQKTLLEIGMGSTEARGICSAVVDQTFSFPKQGNPVGYPRSGKKILLLDDNGNEVATGQVGEIAVKGRNLALGYWRNADLTQGKFLPDSSGGDERIYLTGDLGRMMPDDFLIHLGRKDFQVKIRGFRVEIAEIERALLAHSKVKDAGVVAWDREEGEKYLTAYVVPGTNPGPSINELRDFLKQNLPDFMIPSAIMFLESLPTTNGKLDRQALPKPCDKRPELSESYTAPRSEIERKLVEIWEQVLDVRPIGVHDDFLHLGGHSLTGARLISRVREVFRRELPLRSLFDAPTVADLANLVEHALRTEQSQQVLTLDPVPRGAELRLSFAQERLWFLDQLEPRSFRYNLSSTFQLTGPLSATALERSLNEIVRRHECWRTVFKTLNGQPIQIILPSSTINLSVVDLRRKSSDTERELEFRHLCAAEAQRPFDLAAGPLLRVTLFRLTENEHILVIVIHHIIFDGWSIAILARELSALYEAFLDGRPSPLPELPIQYADFAQWQRQWLQGGRLEKQLTYWKRQLGRLPTLLLPTDHSRPAVQTVRGARHAFVLSETVSSGLKRVSKRHGVTLFITLLAAYQTLLHRYTGEDDIVIGSPVAGRNCSEVEGLIGLFLNMLVLRTDLSGNPAFRDLLTRVRDVCLDAYDHQDVPFEKLVEELRPSRNLSHTPLFQVTFALQNTPTSSLKLTGLKVQDIDIASGIARFDLHLYMIEEETGIRGWLSYNTHLFEGETIQRMIGHFQALLEAIVANPDQRLSDLPALTDSERHQLVVDWNDTRRDYPSKKCVHQLFEEQVERTPDAVAIIFEDQQLSYRDLNARANQLAHYLRKHGVGPETFVAICMERSLEMVVGLLGILKAGGAYVPVDPSYPKERLGFMLQDAQIGVLLTQQRMIEHLCEHRARVVCVDADCRDIAQQSDENLNSEVTAANLAYVIYTSGSTGWPKGVEVPHRGVLRLLFGVEYARFGVNETFLHLAPSSFDASTFEIWGALLHGAKCVLFPGKIPSSNDLGDVLHHYQISTLWLTASLFNTVIDEAPDALSGVRQLLIGGETLSVPHVRRALALLPHTQIINGYGPTESTTFTCCYPIPARLDESINSIPIGRPIANTEVYLLDSHLSPVPIGVPGELYIGGDGLARGYLNRPELTAEKFIANPFSNEPGERLYRTGDLARYLPDGNIEFLGRMDRQVKVRGYRIELGEIESVLGQHPALREAVVLAREDSPGDKRLVGYVVPGQEPAPTINELRSFLKEKLPEYMIPSAFVLQDSLPLSANGKIDHEALPIPDQTRPELEQSFVAPRTPLEEMIAKIWAEVLKVEKVGIHDNFFDLGGHSLLATQVMSRLREGLRLDLPLRALFEAPTIAELALRIEHSESGNDEFEELARHLAEVESLSEKEIERQLVEENG